MQRKVGRRAGVAGAAVGLVLLVGWLVGPVLWVELDEAGNRIRIRPKKG